MKYGVSQPESSAFREMKMQPSLEWALRREDMLKA
jgi:hypothetical protein